jgi:hypothetical protein
VLPTYPPLFGGQLRLGYALFVPERDDLSRFDVDGLTRSRTVVYDSDLQILCVSLYRDDEAITAHGHVPVLQQVREFAGGEHSVQFIANALLQRRDAPAEFGQLRVGLAGQSPLGVKRPQQHLRERRIDFDRFGPFRDRRRIIAVGFEESLEMNECSDRRGDVVEIALFENLAPGRRVEQRLNGLDARHRHTACVQATQPLGLLDRVQHRLHPLQPALRLQHTGRGRPARRARFAGERGKDIVPIESRRAFAFQIHRRQA